MKQTMISKVNRRISKQDYSFAMDKESRLVNANDAVKVKGNEYYCPCCGAIMIPRQGNKRRWHFAHKGNTENCSYETYLHKVAKKRICECFNESPRFTIRFHQQSVCSVKECPLGTRKPCTWKSEKEFNIKEYYDYCEEEVTNDKFRADLVISNQSNKRPPLLIEIYVTHKSTEEKLNSNYRIIEIRIESEEDINQIVSSALIEESYGDDEWENKVDDKIKFYNFKVESSHPDENNQANKFRFWIDSKRYFHLDDIEEYDESVKCLSQNPKEIENSIFRIESKDPIAWDFAFRKLAESGLGIKYCTMCKSYRFNDWYGQWMCILYKSKGTKRYPQLSIAMSCPHFQQIDYTDDRLSDNPDYKITLH